MKNILILTAISAIITAPAIAVQKCVALGAKTTCKTPTTTVIGRVDWSLSCTTSATSITVTGIGVCAVNGGTSGQIARTLTTTGLSNATDPDTCYVGDATYCWCRMLSPAISQWVYSGLGHVTESDCLYNCANECQTYIAREAALSTAIFSTSTLTD